jgi:peroxiredoxin
MIPVRRESPDVMVTRRRRRRGGGMVDVGDVAPDFTLLGASGAEFTLGALRGAKRALLIFYPQDMTSG